jgi:hypothetical protein
MLMKQLDHENPELPVNIDRRAGTCRNPENRYEALR